MTNRSWFLSLRLILLIPILTLFLSCKNNEEYLVNAYKINEEWGYCILKNNKIIIKQTTIPTFSTSVRFKSKNDALKVGHLVIDRIKNKLSPTITKKDLILLKIKI
jgi:hypothetical protein